MAPRIDDGYRRVVGYRESLGFCAMWVNEDWNGLIGRRRAGIRRREWVGEAEMNEQRGLGRQCEIRFLGPPRLVRVENKKGI